MSAGRRNQPVVSSAPTEKGTLPESTPVHQNHRKHTNVKRSEAELGSGRNYDNKQGTSGPVPECPGVAGSFGTSGDVAGAIFGAPEAIFWYIQNRGSRRKSDNSPAMIYQYELLFFHN